MKILNPILIVGIFFLCLVSFTNCNNQDDEIEDLQNQILTLQTQLKQAQDAKSNSDAEVSSLQTQLQNAQAAKSNADALIGELENTIKSLNQKLENSISQEEFELIQSELESASESSSHYFPSEEVEELFNLIYSMLTDIKDILFVQTSYADEQNIDQLKKISNSFLIYIRLFRQGELEFVDFTSAIKQLIDELPERKASNVLYGELNGTTELKAGTEYILDGWVTVPAGSTLRIEAGTIIKAKQTTRESISTLIIESGAKIEANGTAENPIIFTYEGDPITADGTYEEGVTPPEPLLDEHRWGGLCILGQAPISPSTAFFGLKGEQYEVGGSDPNDGSGTLHYVSIRHGGSFIEDIDYFQVTGLVLLGVGSGTTIENVEVVGGLEYGAIVADSDVNLTGLVVSNSPAESGIWLNGYRGELNNSLVDLNEQTYSGISVEGSSIENLSMDEKKITISNTSILGPKLNSPCQSEQDPKIYIELGNLLGSVSQVACTNLIADDTAVWLGDPEATENYVNGDLSFQDIDIVFSEGCDAPTVNELFYDHTDDQSSQFSRESSSFAELVTSGNEKGADLSQFEWTYWYQNK